MALAPAADFTELIYLAEGLSDLNRLKIVLHLAGGPMSVKQLVAALGSYQSATSNNLARLLLRGVVTRQRLGHAMVYSLAPTIAVGGKALVFTVGSLTVTLTRP